MPNWMTAAQLAAQYVVGESRLLSYSQRGNLATRRAPDGSTLYDEDCVAMFFASRAPSVIVARPSSGPNLGILGMVKMGRNTSEQAAVASTLASPVGRTQPGAITTAAAHSPAPISGRDARRRALRLGAQHEPNEQASQPAATGTHGVR